ncbi:DUF2512 family protein [Salipaludibacillus aurantiacus]|uniref:4 TMS phage holin, superfamily IV n=1 Tax=Salipaludibacillus aurantiacus TaxID=1601833 RepID=A0A1H9VJG5_9BACI|nr:DUF2512 family protein [Salipaludibacillus aurantiacus]SES21845.1 Protein of unknown function [Salipaludibacillus aurantiacus]
MEHLNALLMKGAMTLVALLIVLTAGFGVSFGNVLIITLVLGAVSYLMGDLFILPKSNNRNATIADAGVTFLVVWLLALALTGAGAGAMAAAAAISAGLIALGEYFLHFYIARKVLDTNKPLTN